MAREAIISIKTAKNMKQTYQWNSLVLSHLPRRFSGTAGNGLERMYPVVAVGGL